MRKFNSSAANSALPWDIAVLNYIYWAKLIQTPFHCRTTATFLSLPFSQFIFIHAVLIVAVSRPFEWLVCGSARCCIRHLLATKFPAFSKKKWHTLPRALINVLPTFVFPKILTIDFLLPLRQLSCFTFHRTKTWRSSCRSLRARRGHVTGWQYKHWKTNSPPCKNSWTRRPSEWKLKQLNSAIWLGKEARSWRSFSSHNPSDPSCYVYTGPNRNRSEANRSGSASVYTRPFWNMSGTDPNGSKIGPAKRQVKFWFGSVPNRFQNGPV